MKKFFATLGVVAMLVAINGCKKADEAAPATPAADKPAATDTAPAADMPAAEKPAADMPADAE